MKTVSEQEKDSVKIYFKDSSLNLDDLEKIFSKGYSFRVGKSEVDLSVFNKCVMKECLMYVPLKLVGEVSSIVDDVSLFKPTEHINDQALLQNFENSCSLSFDNCIKNYTGVLYFKYRLVGDVLIFKCVFVLRSNTSEHTKQLDNDKFSIFLKSFRDAFINNFYISTWYQV